MPACYLFRRFCTFAVLALSPLIGLAQASPPALKAAVDAAWQRSSQGRTLQTRRNETLAGREAAQSWIAGSPSVGLLQLSDRWTDRNAVQETRVSLSAPIWLPAQKKARETLAQADFEDLEAQIANARLALAGEVRERMWAVGAARESKLEAQGHQGHLQSLAKEVMQRVRSGDLAQSDGMLAQQEVLAAQGAVVATQAKLDEALAHYAALTGQPDIPPLVPEMAGTSVREPHPRLMATRAALQRAQAALGVVAATRNEPPTFGVLARRERNLTVDGAAHTIGFAVQIPIGTSARNRPLETAALTQIEAASAEMIQAEALLASDIELAQKQLLLSQQALEAASTRFVVVREHNELISKSFRLGERGLAELLRSRNLMHEAGGAISQQRIAVGLAGARLNQALGITP
jgi:outer membrane protein TolC